jgi:transporter family-2 protein
VSLVLAVPLAVLAGLLVGLSRQVNGRLALSRGALGASFWNHAVGFGALLALGTLIWAARGEPPVGAGIGETPPWAWAGGPIGVLFVAAGSWLIPRIGASMTALLVIAGQMVSGALIDTLRGAEGAPLRALGVAVILAGVILAQGRPRGRG